LPLRADRARSRERSARRRRREADTPRLRQPEGRRRSRRSFARRHREAHGVPHGSGELCARQRSDDPVLQPALSGARRRRRRLASPRRSGRSGRRGRARELRPGSGRDLRRARSGASAAKSSPKIAAKLAKLGVRRDFDLVLHLPLRYEDETRITPIAEAVPGVAIQIEGTVRSTEIVYRPKRQLISRIEDASGVAVLRFFNFYHSQVKALAPGAPVRAFGEVRTGFLGGEMPHPRFRVLREPVPLPSALTPIYPTTDGLRQNDLRKLIEEALSRAQLDDTLPPEISGRLG